MQLRPHPASFGIDHWQKVSDWTQLAPKDAVTIVRADGTSITGSIDVLADDCSVFWIIQDEGRGRKMICWNEGYSVVAMDPRG
ncbi:hypothetical protein ACFRJ9_06855 [Paenarthrobacter sp. NPDC056912]|uniref:hypothetical protein n=1 Tax=Paenarthrobacter sp. NPDC056912 TaxID=3345965 RepID=UPI00366AE03F